MTPFQYLLGWSDRRFWYVCNDAENLHGEKVAFIHLIVWPSVSEVVFAPP